jgi:spore coat polysaccharide biosynthesis protein SpsF
MEALRTVAADTHVLACPIDCFDVFRPLADRAGFSIFGGQKDDVLGRFCSAARSLLLGENDRIIRATGDNPFLFADAAEWASTADYASLQEMPLGSGVENVRSGALYRAEREAMLPPEREHVCPYLYNHPEIFSLDRPPAPDKWRFPHIRLTIDTQEDYHNAQSLWRALEGVGEDRRYKGETIISYYKSLKKDIK